jgi:ribulose-5-phosphate 4-epimerase/fuculose-1-phosphate aldolase
LTDQEARQLLADMTRELYGTKLVTAKGGNLSVRCDSRDGACWITPSQNFKGGLTPEDMVLVDLAGQKLEGRFKPSVEAGYHAGIMRKRPEVNAVVHTHAPYATVFGMSDMEMLPVTTEAIMISDYPNIPFHLGGTADLHAFVLEHLGGGTAKGAFLRNHGLITTGRSLREAVDYTYMVEHTCHILIVARTAGIKPSLIPPEIVERIGQYMAMIR